MKIERINKRYVKNFIGFGFGVEESSQLQSIDYHNCLMRCWHAKIFFWHWIWLIDIKSKKKRKWR